MLRDSCTSLLRRSRKLKRNICNVTAAMRHNSQRTLHDEIPVFTHFGFQTVDEKEKGEKVYEVFHNVAESYDKMNDVMSVGIHRLWKDAFMARLAPTSDTQLIDVAGGTGDIGFRFLKYVQHENQLTWSAESDALHGDTSDGTRSPAHVTICDINPAMLDVGKSNAQKKGYVSGVSWLLGDAENLPVEDNTYDAYTIAFGIRNVTHVDKAISEAYRALKPGGRFLCLEFSRVPNSLLRKIYDEYSFQVIPVMGLLVASDWHSYQYLVESIRKFPNQEDFASMIRNAGFKMVTYENLSMGIAAIHSGFKL